jgi:hypothetical protein
MDAVRRAEETAWDAEVLRSHAQRFDRSVFREQLGRFVSDSIAAHATGTRFA